MPTPATPKSQPNGLNGHTRSSTFGTTLGILASMKNEIRALDNSLTIMHDQTSNRTLLEGQQVDKGLREIQKQLEDVEEKMNQGVEEIELLFDKLQSITLKSDLRKRIVEAYKDVIDAAVKEEVAACLAIEIPQSVQDEVARTKAELAEAQHQLHNSRSRAANELLRMENEDEKMHSIYMSDGQISEMYPKTLKELFALDDATVRQLMTEYEVPDITTSREGNLNRFMQFCGVAYQMDDDNQVKLEKPADRVREAQ